MSTPASADHAHRIRLFRCRTRWRDPSGLRLRHRRHRNTAELAALADRPTSDIEATRHYVQKAVRPYPNYAQHIQDYLSQTDPDAMRDSQFDFAVRAILDGLQERLGESSRS